MKELETPRLRLRKIRFDDVYDYYEGLASDGEVMKYLPAEPHQDISESLAYIEQTLARYEEGDCCRWAIADREEDGILGVMELTAQEDGCDLRCMLMERCWNQGYGTEALSAVIRFAFEKMDVDRILVDHMSPNAMLQALNLLYSLEELTNIVESMENDNG